MSEAARFTLITGPMFSGKTTTLIRLLQEAQHTGKIIVVFKPKKDTRYALDAIVSHNAVQLKAISIPNAQAIFRYISQNPAQVVGIDEAQFFDAELPNVCAQLRKNGVHIIAAGLNKDYKAQPFGTIPQLITLADNHTELLAICAQCGAKAAYTYRKTSQKATFLLGEKESYEARCKACFKKH